MYKINTHNISGVSSYVNNPDWRVVITNYVCMSVYNQRMILLPFLVKDLLLVNLLKNDLCANSACIGFL